MVLNDLKNKIINYLNESNLSIDAVYYVMKEVMTEVEAAYSKVLQEEAAAAQQEKADMKLNKQEEEEEEK